MGYSKGKVHKELDWEGDKISRLAHVTIVSLGLLLLLVLPVWALLAAPSAAFQLRFNPYAMLSFASAMASLVAFVLIIRVKQHSDALMWFSGFLLSIVVWAIGEGMTRLSATANGSVFWIALITPASVFMTVSIYMFALSYINPKYAIRPYLLPCLIAVSSLFIYIDSHTSLITFYGASRARLEPWGYVPGSGSAYALNALWVTLPAAAAFVLLYRFRRRTIDPTLRQQTKLFLIGMTIPLLGGAMTDGLLSALNINILPSLAVVLLTIMSVVISYGILKYRLFSFTPSLIANQILGTMNEAVIGIRPDFCISYVNTGAEQLLDASAEELAGAPLYTFFAHHMSTETAVRKRVSQILGTGNFATIDALELAIPHKRPKMVKVSLTKLDDRSQPYGYLIVMTDITTLTNAAAEIEHQVQVRTQQLHQEQAKLKASIEGLPLGFMFVDTSNNIVAQNKALQRIFKYARAELTIQQLEDLMPKAEFLSKLASVRETGEPNEIREAIMAEKILHLYIAPVVTTEEGAEATIGCVVLVQDITEEKVIARSKDEFFSIASHELRTPLTAIKGNTSLIMEYFKDVINKDPSLAEMITDIYDSSTRLIQIVNDFLDVSRIEQGKMTFNFEAVDIDEIIKTVFYEVRALADEKNLSLVYEPSKVDKLPKVWSDKSRLTQVVYNLVGNAIKFTEIGEVTLHAKVEDGYVALQVTDTGQGIPLNNQKLLFHKFQQASSSILTRDSSRGTGLGLYISNLIAKSMHGSLSLERSEERKGSTFLLRIPVATDTQRHATQSTHFVTDAKTGLTVGP